MTYEIINPEALGMPKGWSNGMLAPAGGRILFVAGQTASDASGKVQPADFVTQFDRALQNVMAVVTEAGGRAEDIGRFTIFVTDRAAYLGSLKSLGEAYRKHMGRHFPAMALLEVTALVDGDAMVEIEATAVLP